MHKEPKIIVNGVELTEGQAMTVRVALEELADTLAENGLGDDDHGKAMTAGYLQNVAAIRKLYQS